MPTHAPIVITGLGLASSLGLSPDDTFDAICAGRSGLGPMTALEQTPVPDKGGGQACELPVHVPDDLPREARYLRYVVAQALQSAGPHPHAPARVTAVMGTTLHGMRAAGRWLRGADLAELAMFPAGAVLHAALRDLGAAGTRLSTCSACSSGLSAIALGVTLLQAGEADLVIAGGYDAISEYAYAGFDSLRLVAAGPPRPFAAARDGMKTAEGYAALILEREHDARARGARLRGYLAGFGESADAHHLTQPHPEGHGARSAILQALDMASLPPAGIDLISAHATATPGNDASEYAALSAVFAKALPDTPVVAFKSHLGHTLGGAGAVELVLAVLARERAILPPTLNATPIDPSFPDLRLNHAAAAPTPIAATLNLSLGFGGANASVVVTSARPPARPVDADEPVITGVGVVFPGAVGNDRFADLLRAPRDPARTRGGPVPEDAIAHLLNTRRVRRMSDYVKLTLAATTIAGAHAGIVDPTAFAADARVLLGTMHGSTGFCEAYYTQIVRDGLAGANPVLFAEGVPNSAAAQLSLMLGVRGGCQTIIGSRTAGLDALRLAALRIRQGLSSHAFVGAAEEHSDTTNRATIACGLAPGTLFASAAVTLILESRRYATARGARILAALDASWSTAGTAHDVLRIIEAGAGNHALVATSLGHGHADALIRRALDHTPNHPHWSVLDVVPECFSVGPLAALAAILLAPQATIPTPANPLAPILILGTDFTPGATAIRVSF